MRMYAAVGDPAAAFSKYMLQTAKDWHSKLSVTFSIEH